MLRIVVAGFLALAGGTGIRLLLLRRVDDEEVARRRLDSLKTWWGISLAVAAAAVLGREAAMILFALVSLGAYREWVDLTGGSPPGAPRRWVGYLLLLGHYVLLVLDRPRAFLVFLPVAGLLWVSVRLAVSRQDPGVLLSWGGRWFWGVLLTGYGLSHAVWFFSAAGAPNPAAGAAGWFLFLVVLAQVNDIFQALVGRKIGRRRIAPRLSPGKTWEGFLAGLAITAGLAVAIAPWLVPLAAPGSAAAGATIAVLGFTGDLTVSVLKREAGARDSGRLLPGQGGVLDRTDSLLLSGPVFFHLAGLLG